MYHIKKDKRAQTSADLICSALLELIEEKDFSQISITDIQNRSTVSRSTFYRNFDCVEDVLALLCDRGFTEAIQYAESTGMELREAVFRYWFKNNSVLEVIVNIHRTDLLVESFRRNEALSRALRAKIEDEALYDYFSAMVSGVMIGILTTWVEHGKKETEEQTLRYSLRAFRKALRLGLLGKLPL